MSRRKNSSRAANGSGSIRKVQCKRNGKTYSYWQARYTVGRDPGTGKQIQRSITGKSQKEVAQKLRQVTTDLDNGCYTDPCDLTVAQWLDLWLSTYLLNVKPRTVESYEMNVRMHIKPGLGAVKLSALSAPMVQAFYNNLGKPRDGKPGLSAKTIRCIHGILHKSLKKALQIGYIRSNPTEVCELPRVEKREIVPLDQEQMKAFLRAIEGHTYEDIYVVALFTGLRRGEICALTWDCVDFKNSTLYINKQLQKLVGHTAEFELVSTKNSRSRTVGVAPSVMELLHRHKIQQNIQRLQMGAAWQDNNFVFCNERGEHLSPHNIYHKFKEIAAQIGLPNLRFHDLRHSYAVAAISAGDDIKTVQGNLGHATATFTLDVYGHFTDQMRKASSERMDRLFHTVTG